MSAGTIGAHMPAEITLDDVAAMAAAAEHHRYELSREGVLSVMPKATPEHALVVSRLVHWFYLHGFGPEEVTADCGIDVGGGRQPDLTVWAKGKPPRRARSSYAGVDGLLLAIEVVSPDSEAGQGHTVQIFALDGGDYANEREPISLAWLVNQPVPALTDTSQ